MTCLPILRPAQHLPLYYVTLHGSYSEVSLKTLPKNCFLFETCEPGEIVLEAIDTHLWPVCHYQCRDEFLKTVSMHSSEESQSPSQKAIRQLHTYLPGGTYLNRKLTTQNGRGGRKFFQGIYRFDNNTSFREKPPTLRESLYKHFFTSLIEDSDETTTEEIINMILEDEPDGAMFVFVSCGALSLSPEESAEIDLTARENDLAFMMEHDGLERYESSNVPALPNFIIDSKTYDRPERIRKRWRREVASLRRS